MITDGERSHVPLNSPTQENEDNDKFECEIEFERQQQKKKIIERAPTDNQMDYKKKEV